MSYVCFTDNCLKAILSTREAFLLIKNRLTHTSAKVKTTIKTKNNLFHFNHLFKLNFNNCIVYYFNRQCKFNFKQVQQFLQK